MKAYGHEEGLLIHEYDLETGNTLRIAAEETQIRRERTGIHALVHISMNHRGIAWTEFNIARDEDRVRLANSAFNQLDVLDGECFTKTMTKRALDVFCEGLWAEKIESRQAEELVGEERRVVKILGHFMIDGGGTIMFAPPKAGKSTMGLLMAVSLDAGCNTIWQTEQRRVLYVNLERSRTSMQGRLYRANLALGLDADRPLLFLNARGSSLSDVVDQIRSAIRGYGVQVLFLDSLSRAGAGDLTENAPANRTMDILNGLIDTYNVIAHTPRGDEGHVYGSQMFDAAADILVQLRADRQEDRAGIRLKIGSANDVRPMTGYYALDYDEHGLEAVRVAGRDEFDFDEEQRKPSMEAAINDYMADHEPASATAVHNSTGLSRSRISTFLASDPRYVKVSTNGRESLYARNGSVPYTGTPEH